MKVFPISALLFLLLCIPSLHAENLSDIYNEALENDPQYRAAEFSQLAGQEIVVQGRAGLLPNITISGQTNWNEYYQFNELQSAYNNNSVNARFTQPLFRLDSWFTFKRSQKLTDASEADFAYAQQALIVRTVEKYFGVLRAEDNLTAARSEERAIQKQLDQIQQRFDVGLSAITEVQEAQLAFDLSVAGRIRAEGVLFNAKEELNSLIGREIFSVDPLQADINPSDPYPASKKEWVDIAMKNNYRLKAAVFRRDASRDSARGSASNHLPKINITGSESESNTNQYSYEGFEDLGFQAPSETQRKNYSISLTMPLSQGGAVSSQRRQAYAEYNKNVEDTLFTQRTIIQNVRSGFSDVITLGANLKAQKQAVVSARSALEATRVGYEVGTRNIVDLLQSEKNLYTAEKNLANAKYDYLLAELNLELAAGVLSPQKINEINNYLN